MSCPACGAPNPDEARFCLACGTALEPVRLAPAETRKTVTILFCDLVGSTALGERLDPESMRRIISRYFADVRTVIERHGGTVEKFIGDAVMALFGIPTLHEDDALRAVRAAREMSDALVPLNEELERRGVRIATRTGVNTGEVVAGDATEGDSFATGDAVNVAARLEQAAGPGEILIGHETYELVANAVRVEPVEPLALKGKAEPFQAYRLIEIFADAPAYRRRLDAPLVGRREELSLLSDALREGTERATCRLVTVLAPAGVGKSRLVQEFCSTLDDGIRVARGRCLPYGEGITYLPLTDALRDIGIESAEALAKALADEPQRELVAERLGAVMGHGGAAGPPEETFWAIRRLLETIARSHPLVVVLDDIHWAESTLLELVEYLAAFSKGSPLLLLCAARPDLAERRPTWANQGPQATTLALNALTQDELGELIDAVGPGSIPSRTRARIIEVAEGNPLFVEQMLALAADEDGADEELRVPPTIQALLAARIDHLELAERSTLQRASIEGRTFHRGAVVELTPGGERATVGTSLVALVRKGLAQPGRSEFAGDDGFSFSHILIRDAAYGIIPKETRAELHERFAHWLEQVAATRERELDEILGYHLEQATLYCRELGMDGAREHELAARATQLLGAAGERALARADMPAAASLLRRATDLAEEGRRKIELRLAYAEALSSLGELGEAGTELERAKAAADGVGDTALIANVELAHALHQTLVDPRYRIEELAELAQSSLPVFEAAGDDAGIALAWRARAEVELTACRWESSAAALERALVHADRLGNPRDVNVILTHLANSLYWGATPADEGNSRCREILERASGQLTVEANVACYLAGFCAMRGAFDEAEELAARGRAIFEELGHRVGVGAHTLLSSRVFLLAGDVERAIGDLREAYAIFEEMGEMGIGSSVAGFLAEALAAQGTWDAAEHFSAVARDAAAPDDVAAQISWRLALAQVRLGQGELAEAEQLAREGYETSAATDFLVARGDACAALGAVVGSAGRAREARELTDEALRLYERKGDLVSARRLRDRSPSL